MLSLLLASLVAAPPQWTAEMKLKPKPMAGLELSSKEAPEGIVIMPARRKATLVVKGPGTLRVRAWGLMKKAGRKLSSPGKIRVWVGTVQRKTLGLPAEPLDGWFVIGKPRWRVGAETHAEFPLSAGSHDVSVQHLLKRGAVGFGLLLEVSPTPAEKEEAPPPPPPPTEAEPDAEEPPVTDDEVEPALVPGPPEKPADPVPGDAPNADEGGDIPLVASPTAMVGPEPGMTVTEPTSTHVISGPGGGTFHRVAIDPGMSVEVNGPGALIFDLHVHRTEDTPGTLEPVVLGILLDDLLVETLSLATPASDEFAIADADFSLSSRVAVRVAVPIGAHKLQLSLSDNAVLGASVRPRFYGLGDEEPNVLELEATGSGESGAARATGGILFGALGGLWTPNAFREVGAGAMVEGSFAIPVRSSRLLITLLAGLGYHDASRQIEDPNVASGESRVRITQTTVPLILGAAWSASMPVSGLTAELGLGGGAVLNWTGARYRRIDDSGLGVSPALSFWGGASYEVGPGALILRVTAVTGLPYSEGGVRDLDPGAVLIATGYRFDFGS